VDTGAHFQVGPDGVLEIRLPWHALWVSDPSSRQVLADDSATYAYESVATDGFHVVVATAVHGGDAQQLVDVLPRTVVAGRQVEGDQLPFFAWETWETVESQERLKPVYHALLDAFGETP